MKSILPTVLFFHLILLYGGCAVSMNSNPQGLDKTPDSPRLAPTGAGWRAEADKRIAQHRMSPARVHVLDPDGKPLPGATVRLRMKRHAYAFGSCVAPFYLFDQEHSETYRSHIPELFNTVVFENEHKWKLWENLGRRAATDRAVDWVAERGLRLRGHTMIWQTMKYGGPMPAEIHRAVETKDDSKRDFARERSLDHIRAIGAHYRDIITDWDVVNEQVKEHHLTEFLDPKRPVNNAPILVDWYKTAAEAAPKAILYINDFDILPGDHAAHKREYEAIIRFLLDEGAPLGGIGMQGHFGAGGAVRSPEQILETLDRFARFGLPIQVTEFDMFGKGWGDSLEEREAREARFLDQILTTVFSHPATSGFIMWGFWDGRHWFKNGSLFRLDWTPKPALQVWRDRVLRDWRTNADLVTDGDGVAEIRAFHGDYEATIERGGVSRTVRLRVSPGAENHYFVWTE
jgi:GH35 family endo-1,4-beta-xylanase